MTDLERYDYYCARCEREHIEPLDYEEWCKIFDEC